MNINVLEDVNKAPYIGIDIQLDTYDVNYMMFSDLLDIAKYEIPDFGKCNENLLQRNSGKYHITLFNVMECGKYYIDKDILDKTYSNADFEYKGIGSISKGNESTYFVVVKSDAFNANRIAMGLKERDLHITIGFTKKDLFNEKKNTTNIFKSIKLMP